MVMKGNIDVKNTSAKILCLASMREKTFMKYPGWSPGRGFQGGTRQDKGGWEPKRPLETTQFWEILEEKTIVLP